LNLSPGENRILMIGDAMTVSLDLPQKLIDTLSDEAARRGLSLSEYALQILSAGRDRIPALTTGADLVAYWRAEGLVGTWPEIPDSQDFAREIRRAAERREHS
jgi:hypothetical protein